MARVLRPARSAQALDVRRVVQQTPFFTPEGEDELSPSKPRTSESQVERRWSIGRLEFGESETDRPVLRGSLTYDALLHDLHELARLALRTWPWQRCDRAALSSSP
jgi:hypothetical protein